jgi:hypothetical protein
VPLYIPCHRLQQLVMYYALKLTCCRGSREKGFSVRAVSWFSHTRLRTCRTMYVVE